MLNVGVQHLDLLPAWLQSLVDYASALRRLASIVAYIQSQLNRPEVRAGFRRALRAIKRGSP